MIRRRFSTFALCGAFSAGLVCLGVVPAVAAGARSGAVGTVSTSVSTSGATTRVYAESHGTHAAVTAYPAALSAHVSTPNPAWQVTTDRGIDESSPNVATLDSSGPSVLVGGVGATGLSGNGADGRVYAFHGSNGSVVPGWPAATVAEVNASPTVAYAAGDGSPQIFVGSGSYDSATLPTGRGALYSFNANGTQRWEQVEPSPVGIAPPESPDQAVFSTPTVGDFLGPDTGPGVYAGTLSLQSWAYTQSGAQAWPTEIINNEAISPFYQNDSIYGSPLVFPSYSGGTGLIIPGGESGTPPPASTGLVGGCLIRGGCIRLMNGATGAVQSQYDINEEIRSSPAIGPILGNGDDQVVFGTSTYFFNLNPTEGLPLPTQSQQVTVIDLTHQGTFNEVCHVDTGAFPVGSPALADLTGSGALDVVIGTELGNVGQIFAFDGNCHLLPGFPLTVPGGAVIGGVVTANLTGAASGAQDILVPTGAGVYAFSGTTGQQLFALNLGSGISYENSPLVTDEGNGTLDIFVAGTSAGTNTGVVTKFTDSTGGTLGPRSWPMFHHDPRHTGSTQPAPLTSIVGFAPIAGSSGTHSGTAGSPGATPHAASPGYWMASPIGGVYPFGSAAFDGSMGDTPLTKPIIGITATPDGKGYWEYASDGGIFSFGDAHFFGSTGNIALAQPIVGMAAAPDGQGYWMVARDGGIFAYGSAQFFGSTGNIALAQPIVGMAPTPDGKGYWLVARDGGIFAYGSAKFLGSTGNIALAQPIVAMAATSTGNGYWFVAADGGVFNYGDAKYFGAIPALPGPPVTGPVIGMAPSAGNGGYDIVDANGSVYSFGDATSEGSMSQY